jgi:hypothetical protein
MNEKWTKERLKRISNKIARFVPMEKIAAEEGVTVDNLKVTCRSYFIKFPIAKKNPPVIYNLTCLHCGKKFTRKCSVKSPKPKYCSNKCKVAAAVKTKIMVDYTCVNCGKKFKRAGSTNPNTKQNREKKVALYCSHHCSSEFIQKSVKDAARKVKK